ncbi:MAG: serine acetyltransferase [bacterium]|nr:serine acetyltransferase [bacterium]
MDFSLGDRLAGLVDRMIVSYDANDATRHIERAFLPSRRRVVEMTEKLLELIYPGFLGRQNLNRHNVQYHVGELLPLAGDLVFSQSYEALCYVESAAQPEQDDRKPCDRKARQITEQFLERLPDVRDSLAADVQAALDGDPAAMNTDEIILAYPGMFAVSVYRLAHELHTLGVPLLPRIMTEWAHSVTGVDIHPGARIGRSFFIDHGTGVVIGETTDIGDDVKIYQGVTLGALSFPKDERGQLIRGAKRHPTVCDHVTIYANAIVLGGETVLGEGAVIGGSVFVTSSVPPHSTVTIKPPDLRIKDHSPAPETGAAESGQKK